MTDAQPSEGMNERLYKVLVVGDIGTGKTSIIKRYVHGIFSMHYKSTIGVDFALKVIQWDPQTLVRLQLWDIAGQERFGNMTRVYYKEAVAAMVVFDVTRENTFDAVERWKHDIDAKLSLPDGTPIPVILLANKTDLATEGICRDERQMQEYCDNNGFIGWFKTSAKDGSGIEDASKFLVERILENDKSRGKPAKADPSVVRIDSKPAPPKDAAPASTGCCG